MGKRSLSVIMAAVMLLGGQAQSFAAGREAAASFILPTTGQAMNGEIGATKTKVMAGLEAAAITTIVVLGTTVGGGIVWAGLGPLIANHLWSSTDAYQTAKKKKSAHYYQDTRFHDPMVKAQRNLEYSQQRRFDREQELRGSLRERVRQAGEIGYYS